MICHVLLFCSWKGSFRSHLFGLTAAYKQWQLPFFIRWSIQNEWRLQHWYCLFYVFAVHKKLLDMLDLAGVLQLLPELSTNRSGSLSVATTYVVGFRRGSYWWLFRRLRIMTILHARGCMLEFMALKGSPRNALSGHSKAGCGVRSSIGYRSSSICYDVFQHCRRPKWAICQYPIGQKFMSPDRWLCLRPVFQKNFKISRHIEFLNTYVEH